jgi:hypothetical protein
VVGVLELVLKGKLPHAGFVGQEQARLEEFLSTRVGHYYQGLGVGALPMRPMHPELADA